MGRVTHFEITADDPKRAAAFYEKAFGWKFTDWGGPVTYLLAGTGDKSEVGIDGAIMDRTDHKQAVINTISVDKFEDGADAVKKAGGKVLMEKSAVPGQGYFAYCRDTEGNVFGIFENDPTAAQEVGAGEKSQSA
ncbi:MAG TPA: VOC family protein [Candidatus Dormibacteraeota bacterium]|nr:VOC family protein [Candidatus Dormibacteraeota bacterium]